MVQSSRSNPGDKSESGSGASSSTPSGSAASGGASRPGMSSGSGSSGSVGSSNGSESMSDQVDAGMAKAAGGLREAAQLVRDRAGSVPVPGADKVAEAAAVRVETGAQYLEEHSPADMWSDLMGFCKSHPAGALGIGFGLGYMIKKLMP
jgi:hypothetical protein